jgi:thiol-disulfide isomerase/thioredoxin
VTTRDEAPPHVDAAARVRVLALDPAAGSLTDQLANLRAGAKGSGGEIVVELWATWCPPCKTIDRLLGSDEVIAALGGVTVVKVDTDAWDDELSANGYVIPTIPAFYRVGPDGKPSGKPLAAHTWGSIDAVTMAARVREFLAG